jgi:hypothetical protein
MTKKSDLQKELLEKVKPGTKPSHLKRSKSADEIPKTPPLPLLQDQLKEKQKEIERLRKVLEISNSELTRLKQTGSNTSSLPSEVSETDFTKSPLRSDASLQSLIARHKSLKD